MFGEVAILDELSESSQRELTTIGEPESRLNSRNYTNANNKKSKDDPDAVQEMNPQDDSSQTGMTPTATSTTRGRSDALLGPATPPSSSSRVLQRPQNLLHEENDEEEQDEHRPLLLQINNDDDALVRSCPTTDDPASAGSPSTGGVPAPGVKPTTIFRSRKPSSNKRGKRKRVRNGGSPGHGPNGVFLSSSSPSHPLSPKLSSPGGHNPNNGNNNNNNNSGGSNGSDGSGNGAAESRKSWLWSTLKICCRSTANVKSTIQCMNLMAKVLVWCTVVALTAAVLWYSYELYNHGKDPHLIAWFSAGAFVLLGFPISMWGIVSHLANYNQPHVQVYVVRILWMVPIYSIESWLAMKYHKQALYIETLRDFYESYVLYSFLQFLIQVLGGEDALILMLKDKSPTRGVHMWGFQWCLKPWLMGQPVRKTVYERDDESGHRRAIKRVHWKSPFFVKCKFGVLQYVLLKFLSAAAVMVLELKQVYKEGDFTPRELSPIRPVGKFLSVKALVFFTWWQSLFISILYKLEMIPNYSAAAAVGASGEEGEDWSAEDVAKAIQDYLICMEMFLAAVVHTFVFPHTEYSPQAVEARTRALNQTPMIGWQKQKRLGRSKYAAKYFQYPSHRDAAGALAAGADDASKTSSTAPPQNQLDLEMVTVDSNSVDWENDLTTSVMPQQQYHPQMSAASSTSSPRLRTSSFDTADSLSWDQHEEEIMRQLAPVRDDEDEADESGPGENQDGFDSMEDDSDDDDSGEGYYEETQTINSHSRPGFVRALLDSAIPRDLRDNTVGIVKGEYVVERKTLLHHAATSDSYDLFSPSRRPFRKKSGAGSSR